MGGTGAVVLAHQHERPDADESRDADHERECPR